MLGARAGDAVPPLPIYGLDRFYDRGVILCDISSGTIEVLRDHVTV